MIPIKFSNSSRLAQACMGFGLLIGSVTANAAFFDGVDEVTVPDTINDERILLYDSVTSPDGRFTYVRGMQEVIIFSRDQSTGALTQVDVLNGASFPGGIEVVNVSPESLVISPDGNLLYMAGRFGYTGGGVEGDAPIESQATVVKFDRNTDSGQLIFNDYLDMGRLNSKSISEITLSKDGSLLFVNRTNGNAGGTDIHLVTTVNMESQFKLSDAAGAELPVSTQMKMALSPDEQTLYVAGGGLNQRKLDQASLVLLNVDRVTNRLSVKQTLVEDYYEGTDNSVDFSASNALYGVVRVSPADDGKHVYTVGQIRTSDAGNSSSAYAIGVWKVEADGNLSLVRTLDKQELVYDVIGGTVALTTLSDIILSPNGNHFAYISDSRPPRQSDEGLMVFARDPETGLLRYIDDNAATTVLDTVVDADFTTDGRYINITMGQAVRKLAVVDTAVDRALVLNNLGNTGSETSTTVVESTLQAIVTNNGPTDDYAVQVIFEASEGLSLSSSENDCTTLSNGNILCTVQQLFVGNQTSFQLNASAAEASDTHRVTATASSNKVDIDSSNNSDTANVSVSDTTSQDDEGTEPPSTSTQPDPPVSTASSDADSDDGSSGGGCSIEGPRVSYDFSFLLLLLASASMLLRRGKWFSNPE